MPNVPSVFYVWSTFSAIYEIGLRYTGSALCIKFFKKYNYVGIVRFLKKCGLSIGTHNDS